MDIQYPAMDELESFAQIAGERLAEMHCLLAKETDTAGFGCRGSSNKDMSDWARNINDHFHQVLTILELRKSEGKISKELTWLNARKAKISALIKNLAKYSVGSTLIRIHGNLHLAQILVSRSDAYFVNFEDSLSPEKKSHMSPLIDVADILCSFEDAGEITLNAAQGVDAEAEIIRLQQISVKYRRKTSEVFFKAYSQAAHALPHLWQSANAVDYCLRLARINNRLKEIIKASHRPDWMPFPLAALIREFEEALRIEM